MESTQLTEEYYKMITGYSTPIYDIDIHELNDEPKGVCDDCPTIDDIPLPYPLEI